MQESAKEEMLSEACCWADNSCGKDRPTAPRPPARKISRRVHIGQTSWQGKAQAVVAGSRSGRERPKAGKPNRPAPGNPGQENDTPVFYSFGGGCQPGVYAECGGESRKHER